MSGDEALWAEEPVDAGDGANRLLADLRREKLMAHLERHGQVTSEDLAGMFGVSPMTIWRDLVALEESGRLRRVRGGAVPIDRRADVEPPYVSKQVVSQDRKEAIARYAAEHFVRDGEIIFMEAGTTVSAMAKYLRQFRRLTAIGNGLGTMNELARLLPDVTVYCCGGMLREVAWTFVGPQAEAYFRQVNAHTCFLGATGVTLDGITDVSPLEIQVKRAMAASADRLVVLMDSTKFGVKSFSKLLDLGEVDALVTDDRVDPALISQLRAAGVQLHIAPGNGVPTAG